MNNKKSFPLKKKVVKNTKDNTIQKNSDTVKQPKRVLTSKEVDYIMEEMLPLSYYYSRGNLYATIHYNNKSKSVPVTGEEYVNYITSMVFNKTGRFVKEVDIKDRMKYISYNLINQECYEDLYPKRYVFDNDKIYINIADEKFHYIEVSNDDFKIKRCDDNTPLFVNNPLDLPLDIPAKELQNMEYLSGLDGLINLSKPDLFLYKVWMISCLNPQIIVPIPYFLGDSGSGKSSIQRLASELIDPSNRGLVNWTDITNNDMAIALDHSYLIHFDNISSITSKRSDMLCQCVTGGKTGIRKKYTDDEEVIFDLKTRVTLSSVDNCVARDDLASRILYFNVPPLKYKRRIGEEEFKESLYTMRPRIMAEMYSILSVALGLYPEWKAEHTSYHRMNEFEVFGSLVAELLEPENGADYFRQIMKEKYIQQSFRTDDKYAFAICLFHTLEDTYNDEYYGSLQGLYDDIVEWITEAPDSTYDNDDIIKYDVFTKMLRFHKDIFPVLGYEIQFRRTTKENMAAISIKKV